MNIFTQALDCFYIQWLKCDGTQGNAIPPPPIYGSKRSRTFNFAL